MTLRSVAESADHPLEQLGPIGPASLKASCQRIPLVDGLPVVTRLRFVAISRHGPIVTRSPVVSGYAGPRRVLDSDGYRSGMDTTSLDVRAAMIAKIVRRADVRTWMVPGRLVGSRFVRMEPLRALRVSGDGE